MTVNLSKTPEQIESVMIQVDMSVTFGPGNVPTRVTFDPPDGSDFLFNGVTNLASVEYHDDAWPDAIADFFKTPLPPHPDHNRDQRQIMAAPMSWSTWTKTTDEIRHMIFDIEPQDEGEYVATFEDRDLPSVIGTPRFVRSALTNWIVDGNFSPENEDGGEVTRRQQAKITLRRTK